jgi:uncharacterized protein (TIGR02145 family)
MRKILMVFAVCVTAWFAAENANGQTAETGVVINGVRWATRNVAAPGTFAATSEDYGMLYKWNTKIGWTSANPMTDSNGGTTWVNPGTTLVGNEWTAANDPCPIGWRVPTADELATLNDTTVANGWTTQNGIAGRQFIDYASGVAHTLFLPAAGRRDYVEGALGYSGTRGFYWSSTKHETDPRYAYGLEFASVADGNLPNGIDWVTRAGINAYSVRCVMQTAALALAPTELSLAVGDTATITTINAPADSWTSSNPNVATVEGIINPAIGMSTSAKVTALGAGTTTITATYNTTSGTQTATCMVTVTGVDNYDISLGSFTYSYVLPNEVFVSVLQWETRFNEIQLPTVLMVLASDSTALITGTNVQLAWTADATTVYEGQTVPAIQLTATGISPYYGTLTAYFPIVAPTTFALESSYISVEVGSSTTIAALNVPDGATIEWTSDNPAIASVTGGTGVNSQGLPYATVTGVSAGGTGRTTIRATLSAASGISQTATCIVAVTAPVYGCTDPYSLNYNPLATVDDGSCTYKTITETISGCTDETALNYNPVATASDNSCIYEPPTTGEIYGCTDPKSLSYNPNATVNDGSCVYADDEHIYTPDDETPTEVADTLSSVAQRDCRLDPALPIDSAKIVSVSVENAVITVNWLVYQNNVGYDYTTTHSTTQEGTILFYLSIVCVNGEGQQPSPAIRSASSDPTVTGYTVSAYYQVGGSTGITTPQDSSADWVIYPNPVEDLLVISGQALNDIRNPLKVQIIDLSGRVVLSTSLSASNSLDVSRLSPGVYFVKAGNKTGKFIKK